MKCMDRILQYRAGTPDHGLAFDSKKSIVLYATVDASYEWYDDRKTHSACNLHIGRQSASFLSRSKEQTVTADSSTVAELITAHLATKEILWFGILLVELGYPQLYPTILQEGNMSTICIRTVTHRKLNLLIFGITWFVDRSKKIILKWFIYPLIY